MCGRYQFTAEQCEEIIRIAKEIDERYGAGTWSPGEIRPTNRAPVLVVKDGEVCPELQTWGYKLPDTLVINARAETAAKKPMFRDSVVTNRCVVPSSGFFEWDKDKRKYRFRLPGEDTLYMAGLFMIKKGMPYYCILTTTANESMREIHHRMPLVLKREQVTPWLEQPEATREFLAMIPPQLERISADTQHCLW